MTSPVERLVRLPGMTPAVPFMATAVLLLPLVDLGVLLVAAPLATGALRTYPVLAVNHLITLGFGTLLAMGSIHQLFPAMLGVPLRPGRAALIQFALSLTGAGVLVTGFFLHRVFWVALGGALVWSGILLFVYLVWRLIPRRRRWLPEATGVVLAMAYLALAGAWGLLMSLNWNRLFWRDLFTGAGVGVHAALGVCGWFVQLVVSVSYYLLPRFVGAHRAREAGRSSGGAGRLALLLVFLNGGVIALMLSAFTRALLVARVGAGLFAAAALLYVIDLTTLLSGRRHAKPDLTIHHWWAIAGQTAALGLLAGAWALGFLPVDGRTLAASAGVLLLTGWLTLAIMGQLYKVTPFLMWYYRFARGLAAADVPRLPTPYFPPAGIPPFYLTVAGSTVLATAVLLQAPLAATIGAGLLLAGGLGFWYVMAASWIRAAAREPATSPSDRNS